MALYIRDAEVDRLVAEVQRLTHTATKTEAVRNALKKEIEAVKAEMPLIDVIKDLHTRVDALGSRDPDFNMKTFSDELYEGM